MASGYPGSSATARTGSKPPNQNGFYGLRDCEVPWFLWLKKERNSPCVTSLLNSVACFWFLVQSPLEFTLFWCKMPSGILCWLKSAKVYAGCILDKMGGARAHLGISAVQMPSWELEKYWWWWWWSFTSTDKYTYWEMAWVYFCMCCMCCECFIGVCVCVCVVMGCSISYLING